MTSPAPRVFLELFAQNESIHLMAALTDESVYEEIREYANRFAMEFESQFAEFSEGRLPGNQMHWAIRDVTTHYCVGSLQATLKEERTIEIGYRVRSISQNAGVATEALRLLILELSGKLPDLQLIASVHPKNASSIRVLTKSGFVEIQSSPEQIDQNRTYKFLSSHTSSTIG